jgi:trans-aconitate methyltransferase
LTTNPWAQALAYETYMGRWSSRLAPRFVDWIAAPPASHWLDVGCGTGRFTQAILDAAVPASVTGCDPSERFVAYARANQRDPRARFEIGTASALPPRSPGYDVVASNLVLNFVPSPVDAVRAMTTAAVKGGRIAACVWDYADGMQYVHRFWAAAARVDPAAGALDEGRRFPICAPDALAALFTSAGLSDVTTSAITIDMPLRDFADYWEPMLGGVGPVGAYLAGVPAATRDAIARELERTLPRAADGGIPLTARAFVVSGRT